MIDTLRDAWRQVRQAPLVATVVAGSLAMGIGVNVSVFSWVQARILRPLPGVAASANLKLIEPRNETGMAVGTSWPEYLDLRERVTALPNPIAFRMTPVYVGEPGAVERVYGVLASDNYFSAIGVTPVLGRGFRAEDTGAEGRAPVVVISHGLWQSRFDGAADVIGRLLRVNSRPMTIVGVAPEAFQGTVLGLNFDVWMPATMAPAVAPGSREVQSRAVRGYTVMGFLAAGASTADASRQVAGVMADLARVHSETNRTVTAEVLDFGDSPRGPQRMLATALLVLQALMLILWLAVCGNAANLILARVSARYRDVSIRLALGATPARIRALLLAETVLLGLAGAALGAVLAVWGTRALVVLPMTGLPIRFQTELDAGGLLVALGLGLASGLIVGLVPAWQLSRLEASTVFRAAVTASTRSHLRHVLMAAQVALAVVVLVVAGLFLRSFGETRTIDPGFTRAGVLLAAFDLGGRPSAQAGGRVLAARVLEDLRRTPGVEAAAIAVSVPLDIHGLPSRVFTVDGRTRADGELDVTLANTVTPGYFDTLGIPMLAGRDFVAMSDTAAPAQAIVNEAFVRQYITTDGPLESALGRSIAARGRSQVVVGVVATTVSNAYGEPPTPVMYLSYRDGAPASGEIHVRTRPGAEFGVIPDVRRAVQAVDPEVPVFNVRTLTQHVDTNLVFRRVPARLFALLAPLLLALMAAGLYAVVSYATTLRTTEIGVRLALGATPRRLVGESLAASMRIVIAGAVVGWAAAFVGVVALAPEQAGYLSAFIGVPALLLVVAAVACWLPSRRCATVDPLVSLRSQ